MIAETIHLMELSLTALGIALIILTLPLVAELALVTGGVALPKRKQAGNVLAASTNLAVIVPAHNEEALISRCVLSVRASAGAAVPIYVVAHNSTDETATRASAAGALVLQYDDPAARGKGFALRHGFEHALNQGADAVLVVDADSTVSPNLVPEVANCIDAGADVVQCRYEMQSATTRPNARIAALALRAFNLIRPMGRERLGLSAGILGNGFAIRRQILQSNPYRAFSIVEDLEYHLQLVMAGKRVHFLESAVVEADLPISTRGEKAQRARWEGGRFGVARHWSLPIAGKVLVGRLRLLEPLLDLVGLPLAYGAFALLLALCLPLWWMRAYAGISLMVILTHVLTAAWVGPDFLGTLVLLTKAPFYILWKLVMLPGILRASGSRAAWHRTERDPQPLD